MEIPHKDLMEMYQLVIDLEELILDYPDITPLISVKNKETREWIEIPASGIAITFPEVN